MNFLFLLCFDLLLYVHGKQLGSCRDSPLLNRTVPRLVSRRQFTTYLVPILLVSITDNLIFLNQPKREKLTKNGRGPLYLDCLHTCYQPSYRAWCVDSKNVGVEAGDQRYPYMFRYLFKNDQNNKDDIIW